MRKLLLALSLLLACLTTAAESPTMPQPATAILSGSPDRALPTAMCPDPQDSDQPLPPWP